MFWCVWLGSNLYTPPYKPVDSDASDTPGVAAHGCGSVQASGTPAHGCKGGEAMGVLGLGPGSGSWLGLELGSGSYTHTHTHQRYQTCPLPRIKSGRCTEPKPTRRVYGCMGVWVYGCMGVWVYVWVHRCMDVCVYRCMYGRMGRMGCCVIA